MIEIRVKSDQDRLQLDSGLPTLSLSIIIRYSTSRMIKN
jgi:hypothetical protein